MIKIARYLSLCVILASSQNIDARRLPEDCDSEEKLGQKADYYASGSAYSSQFLQPDGTVVTNSKGSSISSDGITRTFHELKKEANKFVSKTNEYVDGFQIPFMPKLPFVPFSKDDSTYTSGGAQQSSFSRRSESEAAAQFGGQHQQQLEVVPGETKKVTTYKQVKKVVSSQGSASYPDAPVDIDVEQNLSNTDAGSSSGAIKTYVYQIPSNVQSDYKNIRQREADNVLASNVDVKQPALWDEKIKLIPSSSQTEGESSSSSSSSSSSFKKFETHSQQRRQQQPQQRVAPANVPPYLANLPANTFTTTVLNLGGTGGDRDGLNTYIPKQIPSAGESQREDHYTGDGYADLPQQRQHGGRYVAVGAASRDSVHLVRHTDSDAQRQPSTRDDDDVAVAVDSHYTNAEREHHQQRETTEVGGGAAAAQNARRTKLVIKVQAPKVTDSTAQSYGHHESYSRHSSSSTSGDTSNVHPSDGDFILPVSAPAAVGGGEIHEGDATFVAAAANYSVRTPAIPLSSVVGVHGATISGTQAGQRDELYGNSASDTVNVPILVGGEPQTVAVSVGRLAAGSSSRSSSQTRKTTTDQRTVSNGGSGIAAVNNFDVEGVPQSSDTANVPILVGGEPQNAAISGSQQSTFSRSSSNSKFSAGEGYQQQQQQQSEFVDDGSLNGGEVAANSQDGKKTVYYDASSLQPINGYRVPVGTFKKHSSSSSSSQFFSSSSGGSANGGVNQQLGEPLVPNSDLYFGQGDASLLHSTLFEKLKQSNLNGDAELCTNCGSTGGDPNLAAAALGAPRKTSFGYSTSFSSRSSNINGKKTENREASVAVNDNGKVDTYHVKS